MNNRPKKHFRNSIHVVPGTLYTFIYVILLFTASCREVNEGIRYSQARDGSVWLTNNSIGLRFDAKMQCTVYSSHSGRTFRDNPVGVVHPSPFGFIVLDSTEVSAFTLDYQSIKYQDISNNFGAGKRLILEGKAQVAGNDIIQKVLTVEMYNNDPNAAVTYTSYRNLGSVPVTVNSLSGNSLLLDAHLSDTTLQSFEFWLFRGPSGDVSEDYVFPVTDKLDEDNFIGHKLINNSTDIFGGGGVPVIDLWTKNAGLCIALIEPTPKQASFPVSVMPDKKVKISIREDINTLLHPGESCSTSKTAVIVHGLDYFDALATFSSLMDKQGVRIKKPAEPSYEPMWEGWGYDLNFTATDILQTLPKVKALGFPWVVIDDRWFDRYGDWHPRRDLWPGGDEDMKALVDTLHRLGFKAKLWWCPSTVEGDFPVVIRKDSNPQKGPSSLLLEHPEWLITDKDGSYTLGPRRNYQACPCLPEVQEYIRELTMRFIKEWGFDGFKLDGVRTVPPCYNPAHNHKRPEESCEEFPTIYKIIYETTKMLKPNSVIENCNCGTSQDFFQQTWIDQPRASDPWSSWQVRYRTKIYKALMGPRAAATADHVEGYGNGQDFASAVGTGAVVQSKLTWPEGGHEPRVKLTPEKEPAYAKWISLYNKLMLPKGDYLNLYDIAWDKPEAHVIRKGDTLFYAFYSDEWNGEIMLRGLETKQYRVYDYIDDQYMGEITGPDGVLPSHFKNYLLIMCTPANQ